MRANDGASLGKKGNFSPSIKYESAGGVFCSSAAAGNRELDFLDLQFPPRTTSPGNSESAAVAGPAAMEDGGGDRRGSPSPDAATDASFTMEEWRGSSSAKLTRTAVLTVDSSSVSLKRFTPQTLWLLPRPVLTLPSDRHCFSFASHLLDMDFRSGSQWSEFRRKVVEAFVPEVSSS